MGKARVQHLTQEFKAALENKISEIEKTCSLEIVPVFVRASSNYFAYRLAFAISLVLFSSLSLQFFNFSGPSNWTILAVSFALACNLAYFTRAFLIMVPRQIELSEVEESARLSFLEHEVFNTRDRTGVLIFISEFERAVFVLADKGILKEVPETEWQKLGEALAKDFCDKSPGKTFFQALDAIATKVAPHFPPKHDNQNELSNRLR